MSRFQKARQRKRLRAVDKVVAVVGQALAKQGVTTKSLELWKAEMPLEQEMLPKDKYTIFDRKERKYRKGIHSKHLEVFKTGCSTDSYQNYRSGREYLKGSIHLAISEALGAALIDISCMIMHGRSSWF